MATFKQRMLLPNIDLALKKENMKKVIVSLLHPRLYNITPEVFKNISEIPYINSSGIASWYSRKYMWKYIPNILEAHSTSKILKNLKILRRTIKNLKSLSSNDVKLMLDIHIYQQAYDLLISSLNQTIKMYSSE